MSTTSVVCPTTKTKFLTNYVMSKIWQFHQNRQKHFEKTWEIKKPTRYCNEQQRVFHVITCIHFKPIISSKKTEKICRNQKNWKIDGILKRASLGLKKGYFIDISNKIRTWNIKNHTRTLALGFWSPNSWE